MLPTLPRKLVFTVLGSIAVGAVAMLHPSEDVVRGAMTIIGGLWMVLLGAHAATDIAAARKHR